MPTLLMLLSGSKVGSRKVKVDTIYNKAYNESVKSI